MPAQLKTTSGQLVSLEEQDISWVEDNADSTVTVQTKDGPKHTFPGNTVKLYEQMEAQTKANANEIS